MHFKIKEKDKLNILVANSTHEAVETSLAKTDHNFYGFSHESFKKWNNHFRSVPPNYYLSNENIRFMSPHLDIDLVLAQNIFSQVQIFSQVAKILGVPLIRYEHTLPLRQWPEDHKNMLRSMVGDVNVFITEFSKKEWGLDGEVVHHGIDVDTFKPTNYSRDNRLLSVVNLWKDRDFFCGYSLWESVSKGLPVKVVGDNPGMSKPAETISDLIVAYNSCSIFLNTSLWSPIPHSLLEAAACGCAIISTDNCAIPSYFEHGKNALLSNNPSELRSFCIDLLQHPQKAQTLGQNARRLVVEKLSESKFIQHWNEIFWNTYENKHL